jgi:hypothetical protein
VTSSGLEQAKSLLTAYKQGHVRTITPDLWQAKKIVDSTIHPGEWEDSAVYRDGRTDCCSDTGEPVFLPFRMSCFVLSNLVVTAGMLTPGLGVRDLSDELLVAVAKRL